MMSFLIKYSELYKKITIFAGCSRCTSARNQARGSDTKPFPCRFCRRRRQSYKKILNFEAYFIKISSIGGISHGIPKLLLRPYSCRQK